MPTLINTPIQMHQRGRRIWLEGTKIQREGFEPGMRFRIEERPHCLVLILSDAGDHTIARRKRGYREQPIIDLTSHRIEVVFRGATHVRVLVRQGCITISIHHHCLNRLERNNRITGKISQGEVLSLSSLFHGGGILDKAVHQGFADVGLASRLGIAVELEGQYLDASLANNPELWDDDAIAAESGVQYLNLQGRQMPRYDGLCAGIPCTGASLSGRSKLKLEFAEDHESAGACFFWFLVFVQAVNPAFVIIENVPAYATTASASVIRSVLTTLGYSMQERVFGGNAFGALEDRQRWVLVAISNGLQEGFELDAVQPIQDKPARLGDVLADIPADSDLWKEYDYLAEKEVKDRAAGKGFRRQLLTPADSSCGTIGRSYNKARSTEPFLVHPDNPRLSRLFTPGEHARLKGIPESTIAGLSTTTAHEVLGQSVVYPVFRAIAQALAKHLMSLASTSGQSDTSRCA